MTELEKLTREDLVVAIRETVFNIISDAVEIDYCHHIENFGEYASIEFYEKIEEETEKWLDKLLK